MKRARLFDISSGVSLYLFVIVSLIWVRSLSGVEGVVFCARDGTLWELISREGRAWLVNRPQVDASGPGSPLIEYSLSYSVAILPPLVLPMIWLCRRGTGDGPVFYVFAFLAALSLAVCLLMLWIWVPSVAGGNYLDTPTIGHLGDVPAVFVAMVSAIPPGLWVLQWLRRRALRRRRPGHCLRCGYDLRATLNRCPECGCLARNNTGVIA